MVGTSRSTPALSDLVAGDTNDFVDVFVHDRDSEVTQRVSRAFSHEQSNGQSLDGTISGDGRYVAFSSGASNLVANDTNGDFELGGGDVFLKYAWAPDPVVIAGSSEVARGTTAQITLTGPSGPWFEPNGPLVSAGAGVTIDEVVVGTPNTSLLVTLTVASDAATGPRKVSVTNPGNAWNPNAKGTGICGRCLTIT